jgi:aminopeptidase N
LYTQFEVDYCHYVFPCWDQPDLKATWLFTAEVDDEWVVITNEHETEDEDEQAEREGRAQQHSMQLHSIFKEESSLVIKEPTLFMFRCSDKISTYLYAIVAGPFAYHEKKVDDLPLLRIYARKTVFADATETAEEMFKVTMCGMHFYKELFG